MKNDVWEATRPAGLDGQPSMEGRRALTDAKVMMVDDEPLMTDLVQTYLEDAGYASFVVTNDPLEAMDMLRREDPGVLLLDLMMPRLSGFELLEAIRADRTLRYTPVIVLTASTGADSKLRALRLGATDFLAKPVDESELVLRVRNTLAFRAYHHQLINFDAVTGLPNPRLFERGIDEMIGRRDLVGGLVTLFSVQVPECRLLRETIDQDAGDRLVATLAKRLERFATDCLEDLGFPTQLERAPRVARLGADQFGLLLEGMPSIDAVEATASKLVAALQEPLVSGLDEVVVSPWVGVALSPGDAHNAEALRQCADLASTHARKRGGVKFQFASADLNIKSLEHFRLGSQLRGAVQRGELRLHYQPKVSLTTHQIIGAEALVRWQHPEHGLMPPGRFIGLAEELGLIRPIGTWVIEQACRDLAAWTRAGHAGLKVAVNVSKVQFEAGDLCTVLRVAMHEAGVSPDRIVVELTESMLMDNASAGLAMMADLKALGVSMSIDDFGTGYSSLSYLKQFPLDELKIDRSFVMDLPGGRADLAIVRTVVELGHSLGMTVIGEGVETEGQRHCLALLGCDAYQGFLFSPPVPADQLLLLLKAHSGHTAREMH